MSRSVRTSGVPVAAPQQLRNAAMTVGPNTRIALVIASLREHWHLGILSSSEEARRLLPSLAVDVLVYDYDFGEGEWRKLCGACVDLGIIFQLVARSPSDDLFLEVVAAGGLGVLWKPVTSEGFISAVRLARCLSEEQLACCRMPLDAEQ